MLWTGQYLIKRSSPPLPQSSAIAYYSSRMSRRTEHSAIIDNLLKLIALGGITVTTLLAPNAVQLLDKPTQKLFKELDKHERERQLRRAISYLKYSHLVTEDYDHGLSLTSRAKQRLVKLSFDEIAIPQPDNWDKKWRIVFFDIPEDKKSRRDGFAAKLRQLGFAVLQRSVFIHPLPCREQVEQVSAHFDVEKYVSYIEADHIDNENLLRKHFRTVLK